MFVPHVVWHLERFHIIVHLPRVNPRAAAATRGCTVLIEMSTSKVASAAVIGKWTRWVWWSSSTPRCSPLSRLCLPPPSNQCCWLGADVIIINMWRQASDDWWEARPNQWWMPDKCLLWRLLQRHLRWSGCSPSLCQRHGASKNLPDTLGLIFNQGLSGTWHYFKECAIRKASNSRSRIENKYMIISKYFGCPRGCVFQAYETNFCVAQTLIRGICW